MERQDLDLRTSWTFDLCVGSSSTCLGSVRDFLYGWVWWRTQYNPQVLPIEGLQPLLYSKELELCSFADFIHHARVLFWVRVASSDFLEKNYGTCLQLLVCRWFFLLFGGVLPKLNHQVTKSLNQWNPRYLCSWGYTWVPWFFMLSGFILCAAEIQNPREVGGNPGEVGGLNCCWKKCCKFEEK